MRGDLYRAEYQSDRKQHIRIFQSCSNLRRSTSDITEVENRILRP